MSKTKIITVCNQKGGCGKTTISMHLAGELGLNKFQCLVVDADIQNSATRWYQLSEEYKKLPFGLKDLSKKGIKLHQELKYLKDDFEYIIIDCPPSAYSDIMKSSLMVSDLALIPFVPSGIDVLALLLFKDTLEEIFKINHHLKAKVICNLVEPKTYNTQKVLESVRKFKIDVLNTLINKRTIFKESVLHGTTIQFLKKRDAVALKEISDFTQEILKIL